MGGGSLYVRTGKKLRQRASEIIILSKTSLMTFFLLTVAVAIRTPKSFGNPLQPMRAWIEINFEATRARWAAFLLQT